MIRWLQQLYATDLGNQESEDYGVNVVTEVDKVSLTRFLLRVP